MDQKPRRPVGGSMDGFITPKVKSMPPQAVKLGQLSQAKPNPQPTLARPVPRRPQAAVGTPPHKSSKEADKFNAYYTPHSNGSTKKAKKSRFRFKRPWTLKRKIVTSGLSILLIGFSIGGWYGASIVHNLDKTFHGNVFSDVNALFSTVKLKGEAQGRVNILVAGDSSDDPNHQGAQLTDSIMVLSIDTQNHTGFMLSVPRDLWVYIPGLGSYGKINSANDVSMNQLQSVVQTDLGIPIDYYALVDYGAFKDAVDAVGGITVDIQSPDPRGLYDAYTHLKLPNGEDQLTGEEALNLARARGDGAAGDVSYGFPDTDFDRTEHQRQMVVAIVKKATTAGVITNPIKITNLVKAVGNNVHTNMNLQDVLRLAEITKGLSFNKLGSYTYSSTTTGANASTALLTDYTDPASGEEALAPSAGVGQYGQLQEYYQQLTSTNPVVKEDASVVVLNGTDTDGLAKTSESILSANKIDNVSIGDAYNEYPTTMIVDESNNQDPATLALLKRLFPGTVVTSDVGSTEAGEAQGYNADFVVVLGQNDANVKQP